MNRSDLIARLAASSTPLAHGDVEAAVKTLLEHMSEALASGQRIEIRGFGSFSLHYHPPRVSRNPRTGESVAVPGRYAPYFKPGKALRERVKGQAG